MIIEVGGRVKRRGTVLHDVATFAIACAPFGLTTLSVVFTPVVLPSRRLFCHRAGCSAFALVFCLLFVLVLQVSTITAHLFLMLVAAVGSLDKRIIMISTLINYKRLTFMFETTAGGRTKD